MILKPDQMLVKLMIVIESKSCNAKVVVPTNRIDSFATAKEYF